MIDPYGRSKGKARHGVYADARKSIWRKVKHPTVLMLAGKNPFYEKKALDAAYPTRVRYTPVIVDQDPTCADAARNVWGDGAKVLEGTLAGVADQLMDHGPYHIANLDFCGTLSKHFDDIDAVRHMVAPGGIMTVWLCQRDPNVRKESATVSSSSGNVPLFLSWFHTYETVFPSDVRVHTAVTCCRVHEVLGFVDWDLHKVRTYKSKIGSGMNVFTFKKQEETAC